MARVIIDSDGHVNERDEVILQYLPEPFRGRRELLGRTLFPLTDNFHRMAEGLLDGRRGQSDDDYGGGRAELPAWQAMLDESGIRWTALYPSRGLAIHNWHSPEWGSAVAQGYNDWLYDKFTRHDSRVKGVALVHIYDPALAVAELRRCVEELGFEAVVLMSSGLQQPVGDERYFPLYEEAQRLDVGVAVHAGSSLPLHMDSATALWEVRSMSHGMGEIISFMSLMTGGVFDTFPDLRVSFLEAGCGWVPYLVDRLDRIHKGRGQRLQRRMKHSPSELLESGQIFVHTELDERMLPHAAEIVGRDDIFMFASDFPHESWEDAQEEIGHFQARTDLSEALKENTLGPSAARFYHLDEDGNRVGPRARAAATAR